MMRPPRGCLRAHQGEGRAAAEKDAGEVGVDRPMPGVQFQLVDGHRRGTDAGIVEQQVQAAVGVADAGEQRLDAGGIGDVAGYRQGFAALLPGFFGERLQGFGAAGGKDHAEAVLQQTEGDSAADAPWEAPVTRAMGWAVVMGGPWAGEEPSKASR